MKYLARFIASAFLLLPTVHAADTFLTLGYSNANLAETSAGAEGIDPGITIFDAAFGMRSGLLRGDVSFGGVFVKDNEGFSQLVNDGGSTELAESSAGGISLGAEFGPSYSMSGVTVDLMAGATKYLISRSISDCIDCTIEQIEIPGSVYLMPQVSFQPPGSVFGGSISYKVSSSEEGLNSALRFAILLRGIL